MKYAKFYIAAAVAAAYAVQAAISDGTITNTEWVGIATAAVAALGVVLVPNKQPAAAPEDADGNALVPRS